MKMSLYANHWKDILLHLSKPLPTQGSILLEGFWPWNNWKLNYARIKLPSTTLVIDSKDPIIHPYCGPKNFKLALTYTPFKDLNNGDFAFVRLYDPLLVPIWLGRTQSYVVKDDQNEFFKMVRVQWWVLVKKRSNSYERCLYEDCWNGKWKCNLENLEQWFEIVAVLFSFPSQKNMINNNQITFLDSCYFRTKVNLEVINASNNL